MLAVLVGAFAYQAFGCSSPVLVSLARIAVLLMPRHPARQARRVGEPRVAGEEGETEPGQR